MLTPEETIAQLQAQLEQERRARLQQQERAEKAEAELKSRWVAYFKFLERTKKMACGAYFLLWTSF
jgi:hypothetical protein